MEKRIYSPLKIIFLILFFLSILSAQDAPLPHAESIDLMQQKSPYKINLALTAGAGMEKIDVGKTTEDKDISISGGGGVGLSIVFGYLVSENFEFDLGIGFQNSTLSEKVENAEGSFSKTIFSLTAKYIIPVSSSGQINFGAAMGYYIPGDLDIDASEVANGAHEITSYDPSTGFKILAEYEGLFNLSTYLLSWNAGLQYTAVSFEASSFKRNGVAFDVALLKDEYKNLDGNSVNFVGGITIYL